MHYNALIISHFTGFWKQNCAKCPKIGAKNKKTAVVRPRVRCRFLLCRGKGCVILVALPFSHSGNRREVDTMDTILINFIVAVAAQVAATYLCKWLDSHRKGK